MTRTKFQVASDRFLPLFYQLFYMADVRAMENGSSTVIDFTCFHGITDTTNMQLYLRRTP